MRVTTILLLAGTAEARGLADLLACTPGLRTIASLAGVTANPTEYPVETRSGGFGGAEGLAHWLRAHDCTALIDATHPYAAIMQANAQAAARATGIPHVRLLRPPWPNRPHWVHVPDAAAAAAALPPGARVLLTSGRRNIAPFAARTDTAVLLRTIEEVPGLPPNIRPMLARPPFTLAEEEATLRDHHISHLVTKNAGGAGTAKLDAAERLDVTTIVIDRPGQPAADTAASVDEAVNWLRAIGVPVPVTGRDHGPA